MRLVIEGPDGSGKTTLVAKLADHYNLNKVVFHRSAPKSFNDYMQYLKLKNVILERSFISEMIYPEIFKRKHILHSKEYNALLKQYNDDCIIIMLNADPNTLLARLLKRGDEEEVVLNKITTISKKYSAIAKTLNVPEFDIENLDEIIKYIDEKIAKVETKHEFVKYLKSAIHIAARDAKAFKAWEDRSISIERVIIEFRKNNAIPRNIIITPEIMTDYLRSLGYFRE